MAASLCCWWMAWGWVLWAVCCPKPSPFPGGLYPQYWLPITPYSWLSVPGDCGSQPVLLVGDLRLGPVSSVLPKTLSDSRGLGPTILPSHYILFMTKCLRWLWQPACAAGGWPEAGSCEQCAAEDPLRLQRSGHFCFWTGGPQSSRHPASGHNCSVRYSTTVSLHHHITA